MSTNDAPAVRERAFVGSWEVVHATLPNGQSGYTGTIDIDGNEDVFALDWRISAGRYVGVGLRVGTHLFVGCGAQRAGLGVALFRVDGSGRWSTPELQGASGAARFRSPLTGSFLGEHELEQRLPDGSLHGEWTLEVSRQGEVFEVTWRREAAVHFRGLGLAITDGLVVGWYPDLGELAVLDYTLAENDPDHLDATWALGGYCSLGSERLRRR